jgi:Phosphatidyl serine synthase
MLSHSHSRFCDFYAGMAGLVWWSGALDSQPANEPRHRAGVLAMAVAYIGYSAVQGPRSVMTRPHPTFWRTVHGVATIYLLALVFLLMQGKDEARRLLKVRMWRSTL